jgi:hypothetical protein
LNNDIQKKQVVYALDILAWDWFYALSLLFAAAMFRNDRLERVVQILLIVSAMLSLIGLLGVPLGDMQIRNIGIIGYAAVAPVAYLFIGFCFTRRHPVKS